MSLTGSLIKLLFGIAFIVIAVALGPIVGIWALNTLFPVLHIELTWQTWLAFNVIFGGSSIVKLGTRK
jgi:hypothetical protein